MINKLPINFQILAMGTDYYDVDVLSGTISCRGETWDGYTEHQMLQYINSGVWEITKIYEEFIAGKDVNDLL